jgi:hypothetical protein
MEIERKDNGVLCSIRLSGTSGYALVLLLPAMIIGAFVYDVVQGRWLPYDSGYWISFMIASCVLGIAPIRCRRDFKQLRE